MPITERALRLDIFAPGSSMTSEARAILQIAIDGLRDVGCLVYIKSSFRPCPPHRERKV